ncbi:MAG: PstS family phosphate ABC transporter substrate-binding protein [Bacteroidales bacterium]|nr:PstS family phosphate ABC transporter substrate-binding protein [Bacteroidales bacterium]
MKTLFTLTLYLLANIFVSAQTQVVRIKGSDTMLPLSQKEAEEFMKQNKDYKVIVTGGGSVTAVNALLSGDADLGMMSRIMNAEEKLKFQQKGIKLTEIIIGFDALAVIVHPSNKIDKLTIEQVEAIFTGAIENWKDLGGDDRKIITVSRESSSGTYGFFKEHVLRDKDYAPSVLLMPNSESIVNVVSETPGAIGYVGLAYVEGKIKTIALSNDKGKNYYSPNLNNCKSHKYPVSRPLFYYYRDESEKLVKPFVQYVLSEQGQRNIQLVGYVPLQ